MSKRTCCNGSIWLTYYVHALTTQLTLLSNRCFDTALTHICLMNLLERQRLCHCTHLAYAGKRLITVILFSQLLTPISNEIGAEGPDSPLIA